MTLNGPNGYVALVATEATSSCSPISSAAWTVLVPGSFQVGADRLSHPVGRTCRTHPVFVGINSMSWVCCIVGGLKPSCGTVTRPFAFALGIPDFDCFDHCPFLVRLVEHRRIPQVSVWF